MAERILHRHGLTTARLHVRLQPAEAGEDIAFLARHQMALVELGRDMDGDGKLRPGRLHLGMFGCRAQEIAAELDEALRGPGDDLAAGLDRVPAIFGRRLELEQFLQPLDGGEFGLLGDADRALALHVAMAAHRTRPGALTADIAAQQEQVDDHVQRIDAIAMLGDAHAVHRDDAFGRI